MTSTTYDNANVLANVVTTTSAVMEAICGNEIADLSVLNDKAALPNLIAAKLQNVVAPLLVATPTN